MAANQLLEFLNFFSSCLQNNNFIKITLSHKRNKASELKNVFGKVVIIKKQLNLSFVYRYPTKDIAKNFDFATAVKLVEDMLHNDFFQADIFTATENQFLISNAKNQVKVSRKAVGLAEVPQFSHDMVKKRFINLHNNIYLSELGISTLDGKIKNSMEDKYRQINKYIEIVDDIIGQVKPAKRFKVIDMGSGKGYLTFALYDYLVNTLHLDAQVTGIEFRPELVEKTNVIAQKAGLVHLHFTPGSIQDAVVEKTDMLIALHACDTATDDAIFKGIQSNTGIIICAPCCHKQIRKQMEPNNVLQQITKHGILAERQAELITDAIRALILEAYGYKTRVFEFISSEHTPKNVLIVGMKKKNAETPDRKLLEQVDELKRMFNIEYHYLEKLLRKEKSMEK
ncbi:MAG: SAM-dependent methyltransferase [Bacteroidota bacterium]